MTLELYKCYTINEIKNQLKERQIKFTSRLLKNELINLLIEYDKQNKKKKVEKSQPKKANSKTKIKSRPVKSRKRNIITNDSDDVIIVEVDSEQDKLNKMKYEKELEERQSNLFFKCFRNIVIRKEISRHLFLLCKNYKVVVKDINKLINHPNRSYINTIHFHSVLYQRILIQINDLKQKIAIAENNSRANNNIYNNLNVYYNNNSIHNNINNSDCNSNLNNNSINNNNYRVNSSNSISNANVNGDGSTDNSNNQNLIFQIFQNENLLIEFKNKLKSIIPSSVEKVIISDNVKILEYIHLPVSVSSVQIIKYNLTEFELPDHVKTLTLSSPTTARKGFLPVLNYIPPTIETLNINMDIALQLNQKTSNSNNDTSSLTQYRLKTISFYDRYSRRIGNDSLVPSVEKLILSRFYNKRSIVKKYHGLVSLK